MTKKTPIKEVASKVLERGKAEDEQFGIDPLTILTIISILIRLIALIYQCVKDRRSAVKIIKSPGPMSKFLMKRQVRKHFPPNERKTAYSALLTVASQLSDEEIYRTLDNFESERPQ